MELATIRSNSYIQFHLREWDERLLVMSRTLRNTREMASSEAVLSDPMQYSPNELDKSDYQYCAIADRLVNRSLQQWQADSSSRKGSPVAIP
jgi:hypothetical protein